MAETTCFALSDGTMVCPGNPFFITGSGRCGTTLLRRLVIERTGAVIPPENNTLASSARLMERAGGEWGLFCRLVLSHMQAPSGSWQYFGIEAEPLLCRLTAVDLEWRSIANLWHAFHALYARHVARPGVAQWGDKTPSNTAELPEIIQIFPQARFIFMVRDVFDMAYSYGTMPMQARNGQYLGGARRWVHANSRILAFSEQYPAQVITIRYEDLVRFPDREMQRVIDHLAIPTCWAGALNAMEARDIVLRPHLGNVLGDVRDDFIGKGRANLINEVKADIAGIAAALQTRLGYEATGREPSPLMQP